ncbi:isochorismate synthase [Agrilactobacillus fermenti]|uniref:isochorismate synthase n=1 Tax=Agrilactobacillus fermenti TaxID=2586909 RepID=UPI001E4501E0|nr:isochorismate synthase [Agrilactobacillus fermenti]MCD2257359.1 isochorismate synthase [Agrilactobacillus fermenti]
MYVVQDLKLDSFPLAAFIQMSQRFDPVYIFDAPDQPTLKIALGAIDSFEPQTNQTAFNDISNWYAHIAQSIPDKYMQDLAVVGGLPFQKNGQASIRTDVWRDLDHGYFFLPQLLIHIAKDDYKAHIFSVGTTFDNTQQQLQSFLTNLKLLAAHADTGSISKLHLQQKKELALQHWQSLVKQTVTQLNTTANLQKVVLSRQMQVQFTGTLELKQLFNNLRRANLNTYHVILKLRGSVFVSATPERLLKIANHHLYTAAVAGTIRRGTTPDSDIRYGQTLLADQKNLQEHQYVVQNIIDNLRRLKLQPHYATRPQLLKNPNVQHLYTPITSILPKQISAFEILQQLHPTPALGGLPQTLASQVIAAVENYDRGLYGAPIGYLQFDGVGEFVVGIRSALLRQQTAWLFAGAGIVADSDAAAEVLETRLKFQPMLNTLFSTDQRGDHANGN